MGNNVVPSGLPAWSRANTISDYGGSLNKSNFAGQGAVDWRTDFSAEMMARISDLMYAMHLMAPFAKLVTWPPTVTGSIIWYRSMAAASLPKISGDTDTIVVTWDDSYKDAYGVERDIDLKWATCSVEGKVTHVMSPGCTLSDSTGNGKNNVVTVEITDINGTGAADRRIWLEVG